MRTTSLGIFCLSMASLMTEISLIRVFDVLFYPNIAYMIISSSLFGYGLAGVYAVIRPHPSNRDILQQVAKWSVMFAVTVAAILPVLNGLPFNLNEISVQPVKQVAYFAGMYAILVLPFFLVGLIFTALFSEYARRIQRLYFWDLTGAALGSVALIPFISRIGPGGLLFLAAALGLIAAAMFARQKAWSVVSLLASFLLIITPLLYSPRYLDFKEHQGKRGVKFAREQGLIEKTIWDPISKIDVINYDTIRYIAFDGGSQSSIFYPFDGNYTALREQLPNELTRHFWQRGVLASHFIKEGTQPDVLVIGSAGGQEIKAALLYGAGHVDGVELVGAVIDLGKNEYAPYIGNLFQHPAVDVHIGEGRSFLRASSQAYDIIQIFSNHTSSSVAAGTGAVATNYLQTADAYREYFSHLGENGILHINHFYYPKMITTAAVAWSQMGRHDFWRHVVVYDYDQDETLPTLLIKMHPWTEAELDRLNAFFTADFPGEQATYTLVIDPLQPENNAIPLEYFSGELPDSVEENAATRITPATDNRPYFNFLPKSFNPFPRGIQEFLKDPVASIPMGLATLYLSGIVALFYAAIFILLPLVLSSTGRQKWPNKLKSLLYFSCLGAGFIIIEFVFIQLFMQLIGSPLYTYSTVIFVVLLGAGVGSFTSQALKISPASRWSWPFSGIFATIALLLVIYALLGELFLSAAVPVRILVASVLMFPVGFFLGMPFPLGVLSLERQPRGAIAWAWGMNGLFTVIGGLLGVVFSIQLGFNITLLIACGFYFLALLLFSRMRLDHLAYE